MSTAPAPTECPNCHTAIKSGMFNSVTLLPEPRVNFINEYSVVKAPGYCTKCGNDLYTTYMNELGAEREKIQYRMQQLIAYVPIVTTHSPYKWEYEVIGMVTGQSTTGTGVLSEFTSSLADLFVDSLLPVLMFQP